MTDDYELITVEKHTTPESIRKKYLRMNLDPLDKALEKRDAYYVRKYYNGFNLRRRKWVIN